MDENSLREIASQLACPHGDNGYETAEKMNALNAFITDKSIQAVAPQSGQAIVEIGPGNGLLSVPLVKALGAQGHYLGIELSADMAALARKHLQQIGQNVDILCCDHEQAAIPAASVDAILAVNVLYFLADLHKFFTHIKTWLRPSGRLVLGLRSPQMLRATPFTQYGFHIREMTEITQALREAGFHDIQTTEYDEGVIDFEGLQLHIDAIVLTAMLKID